MPQIIIVNIVSAIPEYIYHILQSITSRETKLEMIKPTDGISKYMNIPDSQSIASLFATLASLGVLGVRE